MYTYCKGGDKLTANNNTQSRKWQITLNNPINYGLRHDKIIENLNLLSSLTYACMCDEIGEGGTPHTHLYIFSEVPIRFSRLKKLFPSAHIEPARGSHKENKEYISKTGKWADTEKSETSVPGTFEEIGMLPPERMTAQDKNAKLYDMIEKGMTNAEIITEDKSYIGKIKIMDEIRQTILREKYAKTQRNVEVTYVHGDTGTGKTRDIFDAHQDAGICRITTYKNHTVYFDAYQGEDILVFEEFQGQIPITDMLNYLDIYPLMLPARYQDKVACYTRVYITSNEPLSSLYTAIQRDAPKTWDAFLRRIKTIKEYKADGTVEVLDLQSNTIVKEGEL